MQLEALQIQYCYYYYNTRQNISNGLYKRSNSQNIWDINVIQSCNVIPKISAQNVNTGHYFATFMLQYRKKSTKKLF